MLRDVQNAERSLDGERADDPCQLILQLADAATESLFPLFALRLSFLGRLDVLLRIADLFAEALQFGGEVIKDLFA